MSELDELVNKLKLEIERALGRKIYMIFKYPSKQWGLYASPEGPGKGNFGFVGTRTMSDKYHPKHPPPHLVVFVKKDWADKAGVTPDGVQLEGFNPAKDNQASWYIPPSSSEKLKEVARYLARIYQFSPAQQEWLKFNK